MKSTKTGERNTALAKHGLFYAGQDPKIEKREEQPALKVAKSLKAEKGWVMVGGLVKVAMADAEKDNWDPANNWAPVSKAFAESLTYNTPYFVYLRPPTMHPNVWSDYNFPALLLNPHVHEVKTREVDLHRNWVMGDSVEIKKAKRENPFKAQQAAGVSIHRERPLKKRKKEGGTSDRTGTKRLLMRIKRE
ncbi:hypothetical protein H0H87_003150 [Tephrocybe sp. NHM501043]|nr:hypothetical protein H0H87_003150 [Tephrocybe sp. NHM501043]